MRKACYFLLDHWYVPALIVVLVLGWFLFRGRKPTDKDPLASVQDELGIIAAGAAAREAEIELGTAKTVQQVKDKYAAKTATLDATQMLKVRELEDDPIALARYLERLTRN